MYEPLGERDGERGRQYQSLPGCLHRKLYGAEFLERLVRREGAEIQGLCDELCISCLYPLLQFL